MDDNEYLLLSLTHKSQNIVLPDPTHCLSAQYNNNNSSTNTTPISSDEFDEESCELGNQSSVTPVSSVKQQTKDLNKHNRRT